MIDYELLNRERAEHNASLLRDRALMMAQQDWHAGLITEDRVIAKARQYESFLFGQPDQSDNGSGGHES